MRSRSINPFPWPSALPGTIASTPAAVPFLQALYWYWRVATWKVEYHLETIDGTVIFDGIGYVQYNQSSNADALYSGPPAHEAFLPIGWQILQADPTSGAGFPAIYLFFEAATAGAGAGITYTSPGNPAYPFMKVDTGRGETVNTSGSPHAVIFIDGINLPYDDHGTGDLVAINITPHSWFPYRKSDGTSPKYDASTGAILIPGRSTDELP